MPRNNPEGVPNLPSHSLVCRGAVCRILSKAAAESCTKLPIQLGSPRCMVEPCAQEGLFGLMKQERPGGSRGSSLTRPGL